MQPAVISRVSATLAIVLTLTATTALAKPASVFMLQFGSFESEQEATERLGALKSKHSGIVGALPTRVLEVQLPDNLTVYRTQAGPVPSRADAQGLCGQLASNGDECYVVETAMTNTPPATMTAAALAPVPQAAPAPAAAPAPETPPAVSTLASAPRQAPPQLPSSAPVSDDMPNVRALTNAPPVTARLGDANATPMAAATAPKQVQTREERPSFWSRLNPFSEGEAEAPKPTLKAEAPEPATAAPVETVTAVEPKNVALSDPSRATVALPRMIDAPSVAPASPMQLPPPPSLTPASKPIYDQYMQQNAGRISAPVAPAATPMPTLAPAVAPQASPFATASNETLARMGKPAPASSTSIAPGNGDVKVGEAQRVPLSQAGEAMFQPSGSRIAPPDASTPIFPPGIQPPPPPLASPEVALPPSQPMGKSLWADIGRFADPSAALGYWDSYRNANPDFPVVRVRVTQSYVQKSRGNETVSLRVGPFAKQQSLAYLCRTINENERQPELNCKEVTDLGISSAQATGRQRVLMGEANARRSMAQSTRLPDQYWLQLGAFPTLSQAQDHWSTMKGKLGNNLPGDQPDVTTPAMGSTGVASYRVRSGPFRTQGDALAACNMVKNVGGNCIVSNN